MSRYVRLLSPVAQVNYKRWQENQVRAMRGEMVRGYLTPISIYSKGKREYDEKLPVSHEEAAQLALDLVNEGYTAQRVADEFNALGMLSQKGKPYTKANVVNLLFFARNGRTPNSYKADRYV